MAVNQWYVDPVSGNDTTGDGTSDATAWKTIQKVLTSFTQNTSDGDIINLKSNGTHTLTANLNWSGITYNVVYPICFRGYDSTAQDRGVATVELDGYTFINSSSANFMKFKDLVFKNTGTGSGALFTFGYDAFFDNCSFDDFDTGSSTNSVVKAGATANEKMVFVNCTFTNINGRAISSIGPQAFVTNCTFTDINGHAIYASTYQIFITRCYFYNSGSKTIDSAIYFSNIEKPIATYNIFNLDSTSTAITGDATVQGMQIEHNTFFTSGSGTGIVHSTNNYGGVVDNNIFEGWNIAADYGNANNFMGASISNNHFYDNSTDIDSTANRTFMIQDDNFLAAGGSVLSKSGSNTYANRLTYFEPIGDAVGGASDGYSDIGAVIASSGGSGGGVIKKPGMSGGFSI